MNQQVYSFAPSEVKFWLLLFWSVLGTVQALVYEIVTLETWSHLHKDDLLTDFIQLTFPVYAAIFSPTK